MNDSGEGPRTLLPAFNWELRQPCGIGIAVLGPSPAEVIGLTPDPVGRSVCGALSGTRSLCERVEAPQALQGPYPAADPLTGGSDPEGGPQGPTVGRTPLDAVRGRWR